LQALVLAFVILSICLAVSVFLLKLKTEKEVALAVQRAKEAEVWGLEEHARRIKEEEERQANDKPLSNPNFVPNQNDNFLGVGQTKIMPVYKKDGMYNISASIGNTAQIKSVFLEKFDGSLHDFPQPLLDTQYNMNDNGTDGDVLSNDGVYTIELNLDPLENGSIR
jgi:hypothetical protein